MAKYSVTISFETDAPEGVVEEIAEHMRWQLDSMCDGTLDTEEGDVNHEYSKVKVDIKREGSNDT